MQWNMPDEQFCGLLEWDHPVLAGIDGSTPAAARALAAAGAICRQVPRTLTVPARVPRILEIWKTDYPDDIAACQDLLEQTVFFDAGTSCRNRVQAAQARPCTRLRQGYAGREQPQDPGTRRERPLCGRQPLDCGAEDAAFHRRAESVTDSSDTPPDYTWIAGRNLRAMQTNRHQAMRAAARLFALTGDRRYLDLAVDLIRTFVREAPPCPDGPAPAWASWMAGYTGMEVIRASHVMENWLLALPILVPHLSDEDCLVFLKALACGADYHLNCWRHGFFHNYTRHGVRAAAGVGLALPMFRDARKWLQLGIDRFFGDMTEPPDCLDDGYTRESLGYQCVNAYVTAKWYLLCRAHGIEVPEAYVSRLQAMFDLAARAIKPDGSHPCQGETTPDNAHEHYILEHEMLHLGAALFDRPDWRAAAGSLNDDRLASDWLWLIDPRDYDRYKTMPAARLQDRSLPAGRSECKLYTLRAGRGMDALCVQTWGLSPRNHGHHDALHLEVYGLGRTLISDSGFASYSAGLREHACQPQRHSSIHLAGLHPGSLHIHNDACTRELLWHEDDDVIACGLDNRLYMDYAIRRFAVLLKQQGVVAVVDTVRPAPQTPEAPAACKAIETRFAFHTPVMDVAREGLAIRSQHVPDAPVRLHVPNDRDAAGEGGALYGWSEICRALNWSQSEANAQVRPLLTDPNLSLAVQQDVVCVAGGTVDRPVAVYSRRCGSAGGDRAGGAAGGGWPYVQAWEVRPVQGTGPVQVAVLSARIADAGEVEIAADGVRVVLQDVNGPGVRLALQRG